jgi:hypothetical protein
MWFMVPLISAVSAYFKSWVTVENHHTFSTAILTILKITLKLPLSLNAVHSTLKTSQFYPKFDPRGEN